ncbi:helix-turn-helix transcriptional regulator [Kribbella deserti]|uniref:Helix-turn-helix transcriptional regulator n=1 Tax=Kribbella deserti TaxID=1926257 RepID=A0ABV6QQW9_9ACTN
MRTRAPAVVGRDRELDQLRLALGSARTGLGSAIFLVGEPGIGKTRLTNTVTALGLDDGIVTLRGRVGTVGPMVPFRPLTEALLSLLRRGELVDIDDLGPYRNVLGRLIPEWRTDAEEAESPSIVVLAEALLRLLGLIGRGRGCLLVLEDLHAADAETLAILEYLVDNLGTLPVLLVCTVRAEPCSALDMAHQAARDGAGAVLELRRLDRVDTAVMISSCLAINPDEVPEALTERIWTDSAGVPFVVEELLQDVTDSGHLIPTGDGWQVVDDLATGVPRAVVRSISSRTGQLGPEATRLLTLAAVVGHRFSLPVVREATGTDERTLLATLHAGMAAQIVGPDEPAPDWYAFRHPLTAEALIADLTPTEKADLSEQAAAAIEKLYPELPDEWCPLVAELRLSAGDSTRAGQLYAMAGRRALTGGAVLSAVTLLDRADQLLSEDADPDERADVLESLLLALGETGHFDRAFSLAERLDGLDTAGLSRVRLSALHARLGAIGDLAARWEEANKHVAIAKSLLGPNPSDRDAAPVDAIAAHLALSIPGPDRLNTAATLARKAAAAAERVPLPVVACEAWQLLGVLAREQDLEEANAHFERAEKFADEHHLPIARAYSLVLKAGTTYLADGTVEEMDRARTAALRIGAMPLAYIADGIMAMQTVLTGNYEVAAKMVASSLDLAERMQVGQTRSYILVTKGTLAAHQGRRRAMEDALEELERTGTGAAYELSLAYGLARTFCALLEEDRDLAGRELAQALTYDAENPTTFHVAGKNGLNLLLGVLAGRAGWQHYEAVTTTAASKMRWNRQFVELAHAVLLGRDGRTDEASAALGDAADLFPMARHLGRRLVAEEAQKHGWGTPIEWLREAETYFHAADIAPVASACRALLRQFGASVQQRRTGSDQIPPALRQLGVTAREYEVCRLLIERIGNKTIAERLFISHRTVEKHVASLMAKTQQNDRESLSGFVRQVLAG